MLRSTDASSRVLSTSSCAFLKATPAARAREAELLHLLSGSAMMAPEPLSDSDKACDCPSSLISGWMDSW
jgi:hypothetical protein